MSRESQPERRELEEGQARYEAAPVDQKTSSQAASRQQPIGESEQRELLRIRGRLRYEDRRDRWQALRERLHSWQRVGPVTDSAGRVDIASERVIWLRTARLYQEQGGSLHAETLTWWWGEWPKDGKLTTSDSFETLLDLSFGPVVAEPRPPAWWRRPRPKDAPPGLKLRQEVFVAGQRQFPASPRQLDDFCESIAGLDRRTSRSDGVICLAGVRGSGKSTILNRIAFYCRERFEGHRSPLCIRFDLGMTFAHERFARDLVDQICREARSYCDDGPFALPAITTVVTAVGEVGRWCETNVKWAFITLLFLFGLIGASQLYAPQVDPTSKGSSAEQTGAADQPSSAESTALQQQATAGTGAAPLAAATESGTGQAADSLRALQPYPERNSPKALSTEQTEARDPKSAGQEQAAGTEGSQPAATMEPAAGQAAGRLSPRYPNNEIELPLVGKWKVADLHFLGLALVAVILMGLTHGLRRFLPRSRRPGPSFAWQWLAALALIGPAVVALDAIYLWVATEPIEWQESGEAAEAASAGPEASARAEEQMQWWAGGPPPFPGFHLMGVVLSLAGSEQTSRLPLELFGVEVKERGDNRDIYQLAESNDWYITLVFPFCVSIVLICVAILLLPRWWEPYLQFRKLSHQLQAPDDGRMVPLPYLGAILAQVLPKSEDYEELDKISMPFLQSRTRQALEVCVHAFGRVVIIIDDVDILPSGQYHELLRLLRPVSKVPGVCCVLAVPQLFHDVWKSGALNDAHSTIAQCIVVGDPDFYAIRQGEAVPDGHLSRERLRRFLVKLLCSRMGAPLAGDCSVDDLAAHPFVADAMRNWRFDAAGDDRVALEREETLFLEQKGLSRREWLRVVAERLPKNLRDAPEAYPPLVEVETATAKNRLAGKRQDLEEIENLFRCEVSWWSAYTKAVMPPQEIGEQALVLKAPGELLVRVAGAAPLEPPAGASD
jgi:hypothetical protein